MKYTSKKIPHVRKVIYLSCTCVRTFGIFISDRNLQPGNCKLTTIYPSAQKKKKNGESANHSDIRFSNIFQKKFGFSFFFLIFLHMKIEKYTRRYDVLFLYIQKAKRDFPYQVLHVSHTYTSPRRFLGSLYSTSLSTSNKLALELLFLGGIFRLHKRPSSSHS